MSVIGEWGTSREWAEAVRDFDVHGFAGYNHPDPGYHVGQIIMLGTGQLARVVSARRDPDTHTWAYRFNAVEKVPAVSPDCAADKHTSCTGDGTWVEDEGFVPCECHCHIPSIDVSALDKPGSAFIMGRPHIGHLECGTFTSDAGRTP